MSRISSAGVTPPSSLLRTHAPDQNPPAASVFHLVRQVFAGCRQSLLGAGPSRRYLRSLSPGAWTYTPRVPLATPFASPCHGRQAQRASAKPTGHERRGTHERSLQSNFVRGWLSGRQSFATLQAPGLARPTGCSHRRLATLTRRQARQPGRLRHAMNMGLPSTNRDIATCPKRINWHGGTCTRKTAALSAATVG